MITSSRLIIVTLLLLAAAAVPIALWGVSWPRQPEDLLAEAVGAAAKDGVVVSFADEDAKHWRVPPGQKLERFALADGSLTFAAVSGHAPLNNRSPKWGDRGVSMELPVAFNNHTKGGRVEIGVIARRSQANGASFLSLVYATQQAGNSGWRKINLTNDFALSTFTYDVPNVAGAYRFPPIVVLNTDPAGNGRSADLLALYVRPQPLGR